MIGGRPPLWTRAEPSRYWPHAGTWCATLVHGSPGFDGFNGYVWLPPGHPWRELSYDEIPVEVHGGLTFGAYRVERVEMDGVRLPARSMTADEAAHWIGFDTFHAFDTLDLDYVAGSLVPPMIRSTWTEPEVAAECERLAEQVMAAMPVRGEVLDEVVE